MIENESLKQLEVFIRDEIREYKLPISDKTLLEDDLGITGDDAVELIENFGEKFKVDISNFKFNSYFNSEPSIFIPQKAIKSLTVGDLKKAIIQGRLDDGVIGGSL